MREVIPESFQKFNDSQHTMDLAGFHHKISLEILFMDKMSTHKNTNILFFVILFIGIALRLLYIFKAPLNVDEQINIIFSQKLNFNIQDYWGIYKNNYYIEPPLVLIFTKLSLAILDINNFSARLPSLIMNIFFMIVLYEFMKKFFNTRAALFSLFLISVNTFHITHATMVGEDSAFLLFSLLSLFFFLYGIQNNKYMILSGVFAGLAWLCKELAVLLILPYLFQLFFSCKKSLSFKKIFVFIVSSVIVIFPYFLIRYKMNNIELQMTRVQDYFSLFTPTGLYFFLIKPLSILRHSDYRMLMSWDWPIMDSLNGTLLFFLTCYGFKFFKEPIMRFLILIFASQIIFFSFIKGEPWWGEIMLIPAICISGYLLSKLENNLIKILIFPCLGLLLLFNSFRYIQNINLMIPPHNKAPIADYNYDLITEFYIPQGEYQKAIQALKISLDTCPNEVRAYNFLGKVHQRLKHYDIAAKYWLRGYLIDPALPHCAYNLKRYKNKIMQSFEEINLKNEMHYEDSITWAGVMLFYKKNQKCRDILNSLKSSPKDSRWFFLLGRYYERIQDIPLSEQRYLTAISLDNNNFLYYYYLGLFYHSNENYEKSLRYFLEAVKINQDYYPAYLKISNTYRELNRDNDSERYKKLGEDIIHSGAS